MKSTSLLKTVGALAALGLFGALPAVFAGQSCSNCSAAKSAIRQVSVKEVQAIVAGKQKGVLIDSRSAEQFRAGHIPRAIHLPVDEKMDGKLSKDKNILLVFYCGAEQCGLSTLAAEKAVEMGYKKVGVYKGGWRGWTQTVSR